MNMSFHHRSIARMLAAALALTLNVAALAAPDDRAMAPSGRDQQALYWQGHEQLKAGNWEAAAARFSELEQALRRSEPASADAALYWRAYALAKAKRQGEAQATLDRLRREFPKSRWMAEVDRLQQSLGTPSSKPGEEADELVDAAIDGLLAAPPERALPLLKRVVEGNYAARSKKRALFVLSQLDHPDATSLVLQAARGGDAALRREAIHMLGIGGDKGALKVLAEIYAASNESEVKRAVLDAYQIAGYTEGLLMVVDDGSDPKLQRHAVHALGVAGDRKALTALLTGKRDEVVQQAVVEALGIAGDTESLAQLAGDGGRSVKLRRRALESLGVAGAGQRLAALYAELDAPELREAALQGLMIAGDSERLRSLYQAARSDDEKRALLRMLSVVGDDAALDALEAAIEQGERK